MKLLLSSIFTVLILNVFAQERSIEGNVKSSSNTPIEFANIIIADATDSSNTLTYCFTDNTGHFTFSIKKEIKKIVLQVSTIGYKTKSISILVDTANTLNVYLQTDNTTLQTVVIKSGKIKDTVKLNTDSMNLTDESTLRDILNKTEGVMVGKDGAISYNGKQISKVLINKKEVFINQNKIALDNLNYEMMENVQIINNYKDKFNIDFNNTTNPVINIKTKAKFKGVLKNNTELGLGYKDAYKLKGKSFFFSDNINMFLTSNTNNVSEKDLSFNNISFPFIQNASGLFTSTLISFFGDDNLLKKDFNSNNTLTLRKQTNKSKIGAVFTFAKIKTEKKTATTIFLLDTIIKKENYNAEQNGVLFSTTLSYSHLFSKKTVLNADAIIGFVKQNDNTQNNAIYFNSTTTQVTEQNNSKPSNYAIAYNLNLASLLNKKTILNTGASYFIEQSKNDFSTSIFSTTNFDITQLQKINKQNLAVFSNIEYRHSSLLYLKTGLLYNTSCEKDKIDYQTYANNIERKLDTYNAIIEAGGQTKKIEYTASLTPMYWVVQNSPSKNTFRTKADAVFTYKFNPSENITAKYNRNISQHDLSNCYDTIVQSYNYKILNSALNKYNFTTSNNVGIGYYYSNIAKSKSYFIDCNYTFDKKIINSIFDTISNNVFYYSNKILDSKKTTSVNIGTSKGFYFTPKYHKLSFSIDLSYSNAQFPTIINSQKQDCNNKSLQESLEITFNPKAFFLTEIVLGTALSQQKLLINKQAINNLFIANNYISFASTQKNIEWKLYIATTSFKTETDKIKTPNCNVSVRYKATEKLSFAIVGKSLFGLLHIPASNNNASINTFTDGNLITQTVNNNRIGYLILNTIYKF